MQDPLGLPKGVAYKAANTGSRMQSLAALAAHRRAHVEMRVTTGRRRETTIETRQGSAGQGEKRGRGGRQGGERRRGGMAGRDTRHARPDGAEPAVFPTLPVVLPAVAGSSDAKGNGFGSSCGAGECGSAGRAVPTAGGSAAAAEAAEAVAGRRGLSGESLRAVGGGGSGSAPQGSRGSAGNAWVGLQQDASDDGAAASARTRQRSAGGGGRGRRRVAEVESSRLAARGQLADLGQIRSDDRLSSDREDGRARKTPGLVAGEKVCVCVCVCVRACVRVCVRVCVCVCVCV